MESIDDPLPLARVKAAYFLFLRRLFFCQDCPDSDMAMAMACFRLLTFFPEPLRSVPRFFSPMTL